MSHYEIIIISENKAINANKDADKVDKGKTSKTFRELVMQSIKG